MTATARNLAGVDVTSTGLPLLTWGSRPCPSGNGGGCRGEHGKPGDRAGCRTFLCRGCGETRPWCFGAHPDARCDACVTGIAVPS